MNKGAHAHVTIFLGQCHEGYDQGVLLLQLVHEDQFAVGRPEFVVDQGAWDSREEEEI